MPLPRCVCRPFPTRAAAWLSPAPTNLWLTTNQEGAWKAYPVTSQLVENGSDRDVSLAEQNGVSYVAWVTNSSGSGTGSPLMLSYDPSGNPVGPWTTVEIACDTCMPNLTGGNGGLATANPSLAIAGGDLLAAFYGVAPAGDVQSRSYDVYVLAVPLASLPASSGASVPVQVQDAVTTGPQIPAASISAAFNDVSPSSIACAAIEASAPYMGYTQAGRAYTFDPGQYVDRQHAAVQAGLIKGYANGDFCPAVILMRAQVAVLLWRLEARFLGAGSPGS